MCEGFPRKLVQCDPQADAVSDPNSAQAQAVANSVAQAIAATLSCVDTGMGEVCLCKRIT